jgi:hypothetical protein
MYVTQCFSNVDLTRMVIQRQAFVDKITRAPNYAWRQSAKKAEAEAKFEVPKEQFGILVPQLKEWMDEQTGSSLLPVFVMPIKEYHDKFMNSFHLPVPCVATYHNAIQSASVIVFELCIRHRVVSAVDPLFTITCLCDSIGNGFSLPTFFLQN